MSDIGSVTYEAIYAITQSDTVNDPAGPFAGFFVNATSTTSVIKFTTITGQAITWTINSGIIYPIAIERVWSSTTTATGIYGVAVGRFKTRPST